MRIPWLATLDALIDELNGYLDPPVSELPEEPLRGRGVKEALKGNAETQPAQRTPEEDLRVAVEKLFEVRELLDASHAIGASVEHTPRLVEQRTMSLDVLDEAEVRYPRLDGREGLARFVEHGGLFGPIMGRHIASALRGTHKFNRGTQYSFEEGRYRRFVVKRIATIQHLYGVGYRKAIDMFCQHYVDSDPDVRAPGRFEKWLKEDRKKAREALSNDNLSERDQQNYNGFLAGLLPNAPRGLLKGQPFPDSFEKALKTRS